jgi:cadmium resistance protein CadD (predicted permease)
VFISNLILASIFGIGPFISWILLLPTVFYSDSEKDRLRNLAVRIGLGIGLGVFILLISLPVVINAVYPEELVKGLLGGLACLIGITLIVVLSNYAKKKAKDIEEKDNY